jgi:hypothetical protein
LIRKYRIKSPRAKFRITQKAQTPPQAMRGNLYTEIDTLANAGTFRFNC